MIGCGIGSIAAPRPSGRAGGALEHDRVNDYALYVFVLTRVLI
jgi:hypothetical protein